MVEDYFKARNPSSSAHVHQRSEIVSILSSRMTATICTILASLRICAFRKELAYSSYGAACHVAKRCGRPIFHWYGCWRDPTCQPLSLADTFDMLHEASCFVRCTLTIVMK